MKSHPRNARIKGDPFIPNRFVFGDAVEEKGLEPYEYLIHTQEPGFICRLVGMDQTPFPARDQEGFRSVVLYDDENDLTHYVTNSGFRLFDFNFWGDIPTAAQLHKICDEAMQVYQRLQKAYVAREVAPKERDFRLVPTEPLPPPIRQQKIAELIALSRDAVQNPIKRMQLHALVIQVLSGGDQAVFTESQCQLQNEALARDTLLTTSRDAIAFPEVMRADGHVVSYELWAFPLIFSRTQAGMWWHFPLLEQLEPVLSEALGMAPETILWMSPTVFTADALAERGCQSLVHLAPTMDAGCDLALQDVAVARASFEAADKIIEPQLVLAWLPFIVERGKLTIDMLRAHAAAVLDAAMPMVQNALAAEMNYGEAELFMPLPWWDAMAAGTYAYNRKRVALAMATLSPDDAGSLRAEAVYQPEGPMYEVTIHHQEKNVLRARIPWLLAPDLAPAKLGAWLDLQSCMQLLGIPVREVSAKLH